MEDPLSQPAMPVLSLTSTTRVPNVFPKTEVPYRLAIIGEAPGADEEAYGKPFIGASGRFLDSILSSTGILRDGCFIGNVCQHRPPGNKIEEWGYSHPKVLEGWENLQNELKQFNPNCILALGNTPLRFLTSRTGVTNWRGSILGTEYGKVIPSIHPAAVLREYKQWPLLRFDTLRARAEAETKELSLPVRNLELNLSANEICHRLDNWPAGRIFSFDIEGGLDAFPCCSVSGQSNSGFIVAWSKFQDNDQARIAVSLSRVLYSTTIPKVLQNSLYDRFVLAYGYRMLIRNVVEDTMDKSSSIYPELKKGLEALVSIWTREPNYKRTLMLYTEAEYKRRVKAGTYDSTTVEENKYKGCVLDSCCTLEVSQSMDAALSPQERRYYEFNVSLKSPLLYMELRGIKYNTQLAQQELGVCNAALSECSSRLGLRISPVQWNKKENSTDMRGKKGSLSWQRLAKILYEQKSYPTQYKGRGQNRKVTTDVEALLRLAEMPRYRNDPFLSDILLHRKLESVRETLEWTTDPDGRMRCSYNQFSKGEDTEEEGGGSTETGRLRCSTSITGSGGNLQTVTKKLRKLFIADESCFIGQDDLAGADGWTVAAHCLRHGDSTMWEDYTFGLKPARLGALFYEHPEFVSAPRDELKELSAKFVDDDGWIYFAFKRIQHATNYGVKEKTVSKQIMVDSYKIAGAPVYVDTATCGVFQRIYLSRYRSLYQWHEWARGEVREGRNLTSASGHTRTFFGRRRSWDASRRQWDADHETWKEFLADEPQENTTYATNLALWKLWNDPENRMVGTDGKTHLRIEPLHQVHDAIIYQFRKEDVAWARMKMPQYHNNELEIANQKVVIPYEGKFGPSWGELGEKFGGGTI